jgi:hypothetical protein
MSHFETNHLYKYIENLGEIVAIYLATIKINKNV